MPKICRPAPFPINGAARLSPLYKSKRCKVLKSNKDFAPFLYAMHVVLQITLFTAPARYLYQHCPSLIGRTSYNLAQL